MMLKLAWNNIWYNKKRTIILIILISVAFCGMLLFNGYIAYMKEGMKLNYISQTGHIQIAHPDYFQKEDTSKILSSEEIEAINVILNGFESVQSYNSVLSFSGLIGSGNFSSVFIATASDNASNRYKVEYGLPILDDNDVLIGGRLAENLGINESVMDFKKTPIDLMSGIEDSGIVFGSLDVSGVYNTGVSALDSRILLMDKKTALELFEIEDGATYFEIFLKNEKGLQRVKKELNKLIGDKYAVMDWLELNPSYNQICNMFETIYSFLCLIMYVLIFVSIMQALLMEFKERLNEFGTLKAIGMKRVSILIMIGYEIIFLCILSLAVGLVFSYLVKEIALIFNWQFIPPGYDTGYPMEFIYKPVQVLKLGLFLFIVCLLAGVNPIYRVMRSSANELMRT